MTKLSGYPSRKRRYRHGPKTVDKKPLPKIFFCGDPHGEFEQINWAATHFKPDAVIILGDLQPKAPLDEILAPALAVTQVWWIPGNHDSDSEEIYDRLWKSSLAEHNLSGRVISIAGVRIAGLGGVFRGQIWMPEEEPNFTSANAFIRSTSRTNLWRGGLPRRHRTSIFPGIYENLAKQRADVLVTHEAAGCHKKGFEAIDRLGKSLHVRWLFHGHQHEDVSFGRYKGMWVRAVGYRGIVDMEGHVIVASQIDPRDQFAMQQAGEEPDPEVFDTIGQMPVVSPRNFRGKSAPATGESRGHADSGKKEHRGKGAPRKG